MRLTTLLTVVAVQTVCTAAVTPSPPGNDETPINDGSNPNIIVNVPSEQNDTTSTSYVAPSVKKGCQLLPENETIPTMIQDSLDAGTKLIKYHLHITGSPRKLQLKNESQVYKPFYWVRSTGRHGSGLLLLRPDYDVLSLMTLELGVVTMNLNITDYPINCLDGLTYSDFEELTRELVMNDFKNNSKEKVPDLKSPQSVCDIHITDNDGTAEFRYYCCYIDDAHKLQCQYVETDVWLTILFIVITILKVMVLLFSPGLIPASSYRLENLAMPVMHRLEAGKEFVLRLVLTTQPENYSNALNVFKFKAFHSMKNFKSKLRSMDPDVTHTLTLKELKLRVKNGKLLPENVAPVTLWSSLYDGLFNCEVGKRAAVTDCCNAGFLCGTKADDSKNAPVTCSWFRVCREFMKLVLVAVIAMPWLIRVFVYFSFEQDEMTRRQQAATERHLQMEVPGNFVLYLSPLHAIFLFIYCLLVIESLTYGVLQQRVKRKFQFILRKCFTDMHDMNKMEVVSWVVKLTVRPCTRYGVLGLLLGLVLWVLGLPFMLLVLAFYMLPTLNITVRLLAHFFVYLFPKDTCQTNRALISMSQFLKNVEKNLEMEVITDAESLKKSKGVLKSNWKRFQQLVIIVLCILSMYSIIFLLLEFVSFFVEIIVYTMMGLILHAATMLTYVSLIFLLLVYGQECFGSVSKKFHIFNKTLNGVILQHGNEIVKSTLYKGSEIPTNVAFRMRSDHVDSAEHPVNITKSLKGKPRWSIKRLLLFVTKMDKPMIPKEFFFEACNMPYYNAPGQLLICYLRATIEFALIVIFLMFVLVVVLAFGDSYNVSATNQLFVTLAGGFIPFMLRNVVFKSFAAKDIDTGNVYFQACVDKEIDKFQDDWAIYDIDAEPVPVVNPGTPTRANSSVSDIDMLIVMDPTELLKNRPGGSTSGSSVAVSSGCDTNDEPSEQDMMKMIDDV